MTEFEISNEHMRLEVAGVDIPFPKYVTQIINLANQNAQGTRPKIVGQMSELIKECPYRTYAEWVDWYSKRDPAAIDDATERVFAMIGNLKTAIGKVSKDQVRQWVTRLVLVDTFIGFRFQESILKRVAEIKKVEPHSATPTEESRGIDGFIGNIPVSIKPTTYQTKDMLPERIDARMIFYEKTKDGIKVSFDF